MIISENVKRAIKVILPIIFISYYCNITFFTHSHVINGVTIVHSHPYKTDANGNPTHEHTGTELQLINALSTFHVAGAIILSILLALFTKWQKSISVRYVFPAYLRRIEPHYRLRPPPAL